MKFLLFFLTFSCIQTGDIAALKSEGVKPILEISEPTPTATPTEIGKVTFQHITDAVLKAKCIFCHKELSTEQGAKIYITPGDPTQSPLFTSVYDRRMPPFGDPLSDEQIHFIRKYIEDLKEKENENENENQESNDNL